MEEMEKDFAKKMIDVYGEERFYHCYKRTGSGGLSVLKLHMDLNDCDRSTSYHYLRTIGIDAYARPAASLEETHREVVCRIAYGFVKFYKEMGRKKHELPAELNVRMIFGENNNWVSKYVKLLDSFPDWHLDENASKRL